MPISNLNQNPDPRPSPGRQDMVTARLTLPRLALESILAPAGLPPWEELPRGMEPGYAALAQIGNNYTDIWIVHFQNTRPYPLAEQDGSRRLLPLSRYAEYETEIQKLMETRRALTRQLAQELILARQVLEMPETLTPQELARALAPELTASYALAPAPTKEQFMAALPAADLKLADPPLLYNNGECPADWKEQAAERYDQCIRRAGGRIAAALHQTYPAP